MVGPADEEQDEETAAMMTLQEQPIGWKVTLQNTDKQANDHDSVIEEDTCRVNTELDCD